MEKDDEGKAGITRSDLLGGSAALAALGGAGGMAGLLTGAGWSGGKHRPQKRAGPRRTGRARRLLRVLERRPDGRGAYHGRALDARIDAHPGVQPLQRNRLGHHERKPQDPDRGPTAGYQGSSSRAAAASGTTATSTTRTCPSPTAPMTAVTSS